RVGNERSREAGKSWKRAFAGSGKELETSVRGKRERVGNERSREAGKNWKRAFAGSGNGRKRAFAGSGKGAETDVRVALKLATSAGTPR
ncbi:MAG: hypothetical protein IJ991_01270, partial [Thermoguttaceae bacterium]|nr:hypothetical protein [Thermoguttaceae bacterium]